MSESTEHDYILRVEKIWGCECWIVNNNLYCAKILHISYNGCSSLHYHKIKDETFHVQEGKCYLEIRYPAAIEGVFRYREEVILRKGDTIRIRPGMAHRFWCTGDMTLGCKVLEISTTHSDEDVVRLEESRCLV